jgi:flagellar biosynthesis component FlhA
MRNWFSNIGYKIRQFMYGRYGYDELSRFLAIAGLVLLFLSYIPYLRLFYLVSLALLIWSWIRALSKNIYKRQMERQKYLAVRYRIKQKFQLYKNIWRDRKTHKYYKCPHCKAVVRISKPGKGRTITVDCPKCGQGFTKRT